MRVRMTSRKSCLRAGFSLLELMVAGILLAAILASLGPTVYWIQRARRTTEQQQFAMLELSNQMELLFSRKDDLTSAALVELKLSAFAEQHLSEAAFTADLAGSGIDRKVVLSITWLDEAGQRVRPLKLSAWLPAQAGSTETAGVPAQKEAAL